MVLQLRLDPPLSCEAQCLLQDQPNPPCARGLHRESRKPCPPPSPMRPPTLPVARPPATLPPPPRQFQAAFPQPLRASSSPNFHDVHPRARIADPLSQPLLHVVNDRGDLLAHPFSGFNH